MIDGTNLDRWKSFTLFNSNGFWTDYKLYTRENYTDNLSWIFVCFFCLFGLCFFFIVQNYSHTVFSLTRMLRFFSKVVNEKRDSRFPCQPPFLQYANTIEWHAHDIIVSRKMCKMLNGLEFLQFEFQIEEVSRIWFWWIGWMVGFK